MCFLQVEVANRDFFSENKIKIKMVKLQVEVAHRDLKLAKMEAERARFFLYVHLFFINKFSFLKNVIIV